VGFIKGGLKVTWNNLTIGKRIALGFGIVLVLLSALAVAAYLGVGLIVSDGREVIDGNKLDADLAQKEIDHLVWANTINGLLNDAGVQLSEAELDFRQCGFGQWYYGPGREQAETMVPALASLLVKIEKPHQTLHESAKKIQQIHRKTHQGLKQALAEHLNEHLQWVSQVNQSLAEEAGGLYTYQSQVKNVIDQAHSTLASIATDPSLAVLATDPKEQARKILSAVRYGPDNQDYIFVVNTDHITMVHPKPEIIGQNMAEVKDPNGKKLFTDMVSLAKEKGQGFVTYMWPKVGSDQPVPKITYVKLYEPWGWVLGTGVFLDEKNKKLLARSDDFAGGKPFSLNVQLDAGQCPLEKWATSAELNNIRNELPELDAALKAVLEPHRKLHDSAVAIEKLVNELDIQGAMTVYQTETTTALENVKKYLGEAVAAEEKLEQNNLAARAVFAEETIPALNQVRDLLHDIRKTAKDGILTDIAMLDGARGVQRNTVVIGLIALLIGVALAWIISRGLVGAVTWVAESIGGNSEQVAQAAAQVSTASQVLAEGASEQAASLEETSSSMEEMSSMTRQNADNAAQADSLMHETREVVNKAEKSMNQMTQSMKDISASGEAIGRIIRTIDEIAFQTNLLALNAAVEAARAGEAGQGFAVVAGEVRNLAQRAADAAKNTAGLIEETIAKMDQGTTLVTEATEAFSEVAANARKVGELIAEISAASNEQAQGIDQVNRAISELDQVTQRNAATAEESASASEQMTAQSEHMKELVGELLHLVGRTLQTGKAKPMARVEGRHQGTSSPPTKKLAHRPATSAAKSGESKAKQAIPFDDDFKEF
jgi:methyl-accepting chemotaxis protein